MRCKLANKIIKSNYGASLLQERGVKDIELFLCPTEDCIQSPTALDNINEGAELLEQTIKQKGKILIIVDCDTDGFTSAAITWQYIKDIDADADLNYCLHLGKQHGLEDHIDWIVESNSHYDLVICPDSSSNDKEYHDRLGELGTRVLVLDHHIKETETSNSAVIINNQASPNYTNKDLTGAGVVYQFCRHLDKRNSTNYASKYVDLAALGIIGDMGSILSLENRYIISKGLDNIKNFFFRCLINKQSYSMNGKVTPITVAFYIVPLINAMIRVGDTDEKDRLFKAFIDGEELVTSQKRGANGAQKRLAIESARECTNAKAKQNRIKDKAVEELTMKIYKKDLLNNKILFIRLEDEDFPSELNGLIAMTLAAHFKKPTIVARLNDEGFVRGSARGLNKSDLKSFKDFLDNTNLFEYTAGHDNAFGLSLANGCLAELHARANEELKDIDFGENVYDVDFERYASDADIKNLIMDLDKYDNVWGTSNDEPLIHIRGINLDRNNVQIIGAKKDTLRFTINDVTYIQFHAKQLIEDLKRYPSFSLEIVGKANVNTWHGFCTPQIFISDYEIKDANLTF